MFENLVTNLKNKSSIVTDSLSVESLKGKTSRLSDSLHTLRTSFIHKTHSLSSYLTSDQCTRETTKTSCSAPNLNENTFRYSDKQNDLVWPTLINNKVEYVSYNPVADDDDDVEQNIVDKFVRVINIEDDSPRRTRASMRRRNDREEIRRRLASGCDTDEYYGGERPGRKPSLQARLQSGMNLQICFMNDTMSDNESPSTEVEPSQVNKSPVKYPAPATEILRTEQKPLQPHTNTSLNKSIRGGLSLPLNQNNEFQTEADFFMKQARLQAEARVALAQAKDMARLQMEVERQRKQASPITDMLRQTLQKVGIVFPQDRRRVSRQMLTDMNLAQLQVIVNDLHTQIEYLNESLVKYLMERDDLHMSQDSMLVDIEDLTRYLGAKENTFKDDFSQNNNILLTKPKINRIAGLMRK